MNYQRNAIYTRRHHALLGERIGIDIMNTIYDSVEETVNKFDPSNYDDLKMQVLSLYAIEPPFDEQQFRKQDSKKSIEQLYEAVMEAFKRKTDRLAEVANPVIQSVCQRQMEEGAPEPIGKMRVPITDGRRTFGIVIDLKEAYNTQCKNIAKAWQKAILLLTIDENWKVHLRELDQLRQSVQNASYEQKDPLVIYKLESFNLFQSMLGEMNNKAISSLMRGQIPTQEGNPEVSRAQEERRQRQRYNEGRGQDDAVAAAAAAQRQAGMSASQAGRGPVAPIRNEGPKIGRNDPCPCGSGKKYKNCHGKL
jgi:preprotein translocase subunit SecA